MDFEEWFESLALDNWTNKKYMHDAFEAGEQSKQEEVNKLQKEIDELKKQIDSVKELSEYWYRSSGSALALNILELLK